MRRESPNEYIKWHAPEGAVDEERLRLAHEALSKPIGRVEYSDSDNVQIENAPFLIEFSYITISEDTAKLFSNNPHNKGVNPGTLREITSWKLTRMDKNVSLSFSDILPGGYKVFLVQLIKIGLAM